ncbi:MAG: 3'-5' exonuclease [Oscillospiraceae bacterium]
MNKNKKYGGIAIDTETTGLDSNVDEILQVSIVDESGFAIYNAFFKPRNHTEWAEAEKVNHITPEMVRNCPDISGSVAAISRILASAEKIIGYNTPFDLGFLAAAGVEIPADAEIVDVMQMFAEIKGDWDEVRNGLKWHKLTECAEYCGYKWGGTAHDSFQDARATMYCYKQIVANGKDSAE